MPLAKQRVEFGDWQTPLELALAAVRSLPSFAPATIVEPTCGEGTFLRAALTEYPEAVGRGYEVNESYCQVARELVPSAEIRVADFFHHDWETEASSWRDPVLIIGTPPWVTAAGSCTLSWCALWTIAR